MQPASLVASEGLVQPEFLGCATDVVKPPLCRLAAAGYRRLAPARERITRVVLLGPPHFVGFHGLAVASADGWQTPLGSVSVDRPLVVRLIGAKLIEVLDAAHAREHSLEVHLPFLQVALGEFALVPIVTGEAFCQPSAEAAASP